MITADLTKNEKQTTFVTTVLEAVLGQSPLRYLFYGGAIRGGKTFACLVCLVLFCRMFPGSKWYVIRKSFPSLKETTIPALEKILGKSRRWRWNRDKSNYYAEYENGSRIFFASEDFARDPKLSWLLGLEANGFFLEQVEELQFLTLEMCISRAGSWYVTPMPMPIVLGSFNPSLTWVRDKIFVPHQEGELEAPYFYLDASPKDNPYVTEEQWKGWGNMSDALQQQFVEGSWDFEKASNVFAFNFDENLHHAPVTYDDNQVLKLSFDFNVEPITCLAAQDQKFEYIHIIKEFRLLNSDIDDLCDHIAAAFPNGHFLVTGDASGSARNALKKNTNYYKSIKHNLQLSPLQLKVPRANPSVRNTRVLTNSLWNKHPNMFVNKHACPFLVTDLNQVVVDAAGDIDKTKDAHKTHLLDCFRYYCWTFHRDFLDKSVYLYAGNN